MGKLMLWDRIKPWLRHPLDMMSAEIAGRYMKRHGLVMEHAGRYEEMRSRLNGV